MHAVGTVGTVGTHTVPRMPARPLRCRRLARRSNRSTVPGGGLVRPINVFLRNGVWNGGGTDQRLDARRDPIGVLPPGGEGDGERALFTLVPSLEFAERCYNTARGGEIPEELWVDCVVASNVDPSLAPAGRHVMTCFVPSTTVMSSR